MNFHELTKTVAKYEGKKVQVNIGQIKEVTRVVLSLLADEFQRSPYDFVLWLGRYQNTLLQFQKEGQDDD